MNGSNLAFQPRTIWFELALIILVAAIRWMTYILRAPWIGVLVLGVTVLVDRYFASGMRQKTFLILLIFQLTVVVLFVVPFMVWPIDMLVAGLLTWGILQRLVPVHYITYWKFR